MGITEDRASRIVVIMKEQRLANPYFNQLSSFLMLEFHRRKISASLVLSGAGSSLPLSGPSRPTGAILIDDVDEKLLGSIRDAKIPVVWLDAPSVDMNFDYVCSDNYTGAYRMAEYVASMDHRRILFLGNKDSHIDFYNRYQGLKSYIDEHPRQGLTLMELPAYPERVGFNTQQFNQMMSRPDRPTIIFAVNDDTARLAADELRQMNLQVPEDVSLTGFDNIMEYLDESVESLTTVHISMINQALAAVETLFRRIQEPSVAPRRILVETKLVKRNSLIRNRAATEAGGHELSVFTGGRIDTSV